MRAILVGMFNDMFRFAGREPSSRKSDVAPGAVLKAIRRFAASAATVLVQLLSGAVLVSVMVADAAGADASQRIRSFSVDRHRTELEFFVPSELSTSARAKPGEAEWKEWRIVELEAHAKSLLEKWGFKDAANSKLKQIQCESISTSNGPLWYYVVFLSDPLEPDSAKRIGLTALFLANGAEPVVKKHAGPRAEQ